jgi:hypothetical protein
MPIKWEPASKEELEARSAPKPSKPTKKASAKKGAS